MTFDEYRQGGRAHYAAFVDAVRLVLAAAVKSAGMSPHALTGRAKDYASLAKKLKDNGIPLESAIDEALKDLAGVRLVFLTNRQVDRFRNSAILRENFEILNVNEHHPVPGTVSETRLFDSTNLCVRLRAERLALPEYQEFAGLKVEIQIQTLLNHAWAEMSHDTSYKGPDLRHVDGEQLKRIDERLHEVMVEHLLPAGHDFDKIARDFDLLVRADRDFKPVVASIATSSSNNELAQSLETLDQIVLPRLADRGRRYIELLPSIVAAVERARGTPAEIVEAPFGSFPGASGEDVARKASSLIDHYRYCDPQMTFETLLALYLGAEEDDRAIWLDLGRSFAENSIAVFQSHGPLVQRILVDGFTALAPDRRWAARDLMIATMEKVLSSEITGTSQGGFHEINFQMGSVPVSRETQRVRADAIALLGSLLDAATEDVTRFRILRALNEACRAPYNGASVPIRIMVMNDAASVAEISHRAASAGGLELRRRVEVDALHVHSWYHVLPSSMRGEAELVDAQSRLMTKLSALRDELNADEDFRLYKTLIGYDSVHPDAWAGNHFDFKARDQWRLDQRAPIIEQIDEEASSWTSKMRKYLAQPLDTGQDMPLINFSRAMAANRPQIGIRLLQDMDEVLRRLIAPLLEGMEEAGRTDAAVHAASTFVREGRFLFELAYWLADRKVPDASLLVGVSARAREIGDNRAVLASLNAAGRQYGVLADPALIADVLVPAVDYTIEAKLTDWPRDAWAISQGGILGALNDTQSDQVLLSIVGANDVTHDAERILAKIAGHFPRKVLEFFEARIRRGREDAGERVDPVPFHLNELPSALARHPALVLQSARRMYDLRKSAHRFYGGRLVAKLFPELDGALAAPLATIIANGGRDDQAFVLATLQPYEGVEAVYPLCMDVVDRLDRDDELLRRVSAVLGESGVLSGDFGRVEAELERHERLKPYRTDPRPKVAAFAESQIRAALQSMAEEQRRALREREQAVRDWGVSPKSRRGEGVVDD